MGLYPEGLKLGGFSVGFYGKEVDSGWKMRKIIFLNFFYCTPKKIKAWSNLPLKTTRDSFESLILNVKNVTVRIHPKILIL